MTEPPAAAYLWLLALLSADSQLVAAAPGGVWRGLAPAGTTTPYVVVSRQGGGDVLSGNAIRLMTSDTYQVAAFAPAASFSALVAVASRLDALLGRTAQSAGGITILACYREQAVALDELVGGVLWSRLGGLYRILL